MLIADILGGRVAAVPPVSDQVSRVAGICKELNITDMCKKRHLSEDDVIHVMIKACEDEPAVYAAKMGVATPDIESISSVVGDWVSRRK